jgi:XTP/dITP diphosphohydrolase
MQLLFITGNPTKVRHAEVALSGLDIQVVQKKYSLTEPRLESPEEIVLAKAAEAFSVFNLPLIVEDSGIFITALNGFPKTFVHFAVSTIGVAGIVKLLAGESDRSAEFHQSLAYISPSQPEPRVFSYVDGGYRVADKVWTPEFEDTADFDKILIPPGQDKPLCMFPAAWRAERDTSQNADTIHYRQLARYLSQVV